MFIIVISSHVLPNIPYLELFQHEDLLLFSVLLISVN